MNVTGLSILSLLSIFIIGYGIAAGSSYDRLELELVDSRAEMADFQLADIDGDGLNEFIELFNNRRGYITRELTRERLIGPAVEQANFLYHISAITPVDIDSIPGFEIAVVLRDDAGDSLWVEIVSGLDPKQVYCRTEAVCGKNISDRGSHHIPGWDGQVAKCYFDDLDGDGALEIIVPVTVSFDLYPRGIYVYSYPEGKLLWKFLTAGVPLFMSFADADGDGLRETYFKTWACFNGAEVDGRSDTAAYAFALSHTGEIIWMTNLGDRFDRQTGNPLLCDCDGDDTLEIYYNIILRGDEYDRHVRILEKHRAVDNLHLQQRSFDADHRFRQIFSADMDADGQIDLVINDRPSVLDVADLSVKDEGGLKVFDIESIVNIDPDSNSPPEIFVKKKDSLYILNSQCDILASYRTERGGLIRKVVYFNTPFGRRIIALLVDVYSDGIRNKMIYLLEISPARSQSYLSALLDAYRLFWPTVIAAFLLGMPAGVILYRSYRRKKRRHKSKPEPYMDMFGALATFNHGQAGGKNLNRLSFLFANLPDNEIKLEEIKPNLKSAAETYQSFTASQLDSIVRQSQRLKPIRPMVNALGRNVDRLDSVLSKLSIDSLSIDDDSHWEKTLPEIISKIQSAIGKIKSRVQTKVSTDLGDIIPLVLVAIRGQMKRDGVGFKKIIAGGGGRFPVFFAEAELAAIIEELFVNAINAMNGSASKELSVYVDMTSDEVVFKLSDSGCGFREDELAMIFNRDYSTKEGGGGYGLFHVRQQVERFGGRVKIENNKDGVGANVKLNLKMVSHDE